MGGHGHDHSHSGGGGVTDRRKLAITFTLACAVVVMQVVGAVLTGSIALLADTVHTVTDAAGSGVALLVDKLMHRPPTHRRTWGMRRLEVLTVFLRAAVLLGVGVYVIVEGIQRLLAPPEVPGRELVIFGGLGLLANLVSLVILTDGLGGKIFPWSRGYADGQVAPEGQTPAASRNPSHRAAVGGRSFNMRAAVLEVLNDAIGSVGVLVAALVMWLTGWQRADALAGLLIAALIVPRSIALLRETVDVLLESTPPGLDLAAVRADFLEIDHVVAVHDLHASLISSGLPTLTAHIVAEESCFTDGHVRELLDRLQHRASSHYGIPIEHTTFQIEPPPHAAHEHPMHA